MKKSPIAQRTAVLALSVALCTPLAVRAQNVAIVNGKAVPKARVELLITQVVKGGQQTRTPELEKKVRDEVVMREMYMQEADKRGISTSADVRAQLELARQAIVIRALFTEYTKANPVGEPELKAEYDKFKNQSKGTEYHARHILVEKEDEAVALIAKIKGGAKFEDLAKTASKDPGSGANGGDLDWASATSYVPEFSQAMVKLKKGEMTDTPVKSQFGYHIILLEDTREPQFPPYEDVKAQIAQRLSQQKEAQFRDDIRAKAKTDYKFSD